MAEAGSLTERELSSAHPGAVANPSPSQVDPQRAGGWQAPQESRSSPENNPFAPNNLLSKRVGTGPSWFHRCRADSRRPTPGTAVPL